MTFCFLTIKYQKVPTCKYQKKGILKSPKNAKQKTLERGTLKEPKIDNQNAQKSANEKAPRVSTRKRKKKCLAESVSKCQLKSKNNFEPKSANCTLKFISRSLTMIALALLSLIQQSSVKCHSYFFSPLAGRQTDQQTKGRHKKASFFWTLSKSGLDPPFPSFWTPVR